MRMQFDPSSRQRGHPLPSATSSVAHREGVFRSMKGGGHRSVNTAWHKEVAMAFRKAGWIC